MMLSKGKITEELVDMLMTWRPSGFNVFSGLRIRPGEEEAIENLARYIKNLKSIKPLFAAQLPGDGSLHLAKDFFTLFPEDLFDSLTAPRHDQLVRVNKIITQMRCQQLAHGGFTGPHETGDNDIGSGHDCHSIALFK